MIRRVAGRPARRGPSELTHLREVAAESREEWRLAHQAVRSTLDGHMTRVYVDGERRRDLECRCSGCALARASWLGGSMDTVRLFSADGYRGRGGAFL